MNSRTCPNCGENWHSADTLTDWKCEKCGGTIPLNRPTTPAQDDERARDEGSPKVTKVLWYSKKCDWDLWLEKKLKQLFKKET